MVNRIQRKVSALSRRYRIGWKSGVLLLACVSAGLCVTSKASATQEAANRDNQALVLFQQGLSLADHGRLAQAELKLEQASALTPDDIEILTALAKVKARLRELPAALVIFRQVIAAAPNSSEAHLNLAIALADNSDLSGALDEATRAAELAPELPSTHLNRARILADLGRMDEARTEFATASRLAPANPDSFYYWALLERDSNNLGKETELLSDVVRLQPRNEKALRLLADGLLSQGRRQESIAMWRRLLKINPNSREAAYGLSRALRTTDPQESMRMLQRFLALKQRDDQLEHVKSLGNQAYVAMNKGQWSEAISCLSEAINQCGDCEVLADLHKDLGLALCHSGSIAEGKKELQIALHLNPSDRDTLQALNAVSGR
jgi:tetratricopeptide (TPR) repeat protein